MSSYFSESIDQEQETSQQWWFLRTLAKNAGFIFLIFRHVIILDLPQRVLVLPHTACQLGALVAFCNFLWPLGLLLCSINKFKLFGKKKRTDNLCSASSNYIFKVNPILPKLDQPKKLKFREGAEETPLP